MASDPTADWVKLADVDELRDAGRLQTAAGGRTFAAFWHDGEPHVVDSRCPHMGFPLVEGTVEDGVLTCPWHHARFELSCGDTFDPFADDVQTYPIEVRNGTIYVNPTPPRDAAAEEHWNDRLDHGLKENIDLVVAKSVIGLDDAGAAYTIPLASGVTFGTHYRQDGWGSGLTTLAAMANLVDDLRAEDRRRALYVGLTEVAADCAGEPPFFVQEPLAASTVPGARLKRWFRDNIEVRDADGAERVLRAAITADQPASAIADMLVAAATDHLYLDTGHRLDFINKAVETLDHLGWEYADDVLPSLVPALATADRAEEDSAWRQPIDIAGLCFDAADELPALVDDAPESPWQEPDDFIDTLVGDDPHAISNALTRAIANGATAPELARAVAYTAARRIAQFGTSNEFRDWNTVHHTYSYANAVYELAGRADSHEIYRGVFDAAMNVYLDRFLNTPPAPIPDPAGNRPPDAVLNDLMETFEIEAAEEVNRAGRLTAEFIAADGSIDRLKRLLGKVLLREDAGFHPRQNCEAAFNQFGAAPSTVRGRVHLIATARYLAAHTPTRRAGEQTFRIADRLHRGEKIHEA